MSHISDDSIESKKSIPEELVTKGSASWPVGDQDRINVILKHLIKISGHRDHTVLDICVLSAVQDITQTKNASIMEVSIVDECVHLRDRAALVEGKVESIDENYAVSSGNQPVTKWPKLADGIAKHSPTITEMHEGEHLLWMPIWFKDSMIGCLRIQRPEAFMSSTIDVLEGMVHVYRNFMMLLDYSERDSLTGLLNRKTFDDSLSKMQAGEIATPILENDSRQEPSSESSHWLAIVDIDHFKRVNDTFGHLYGDEVLILVSNFMKNSFRVQDRVFRFGGEEFVVLLRCATLEDIRKTLERFRKKIESHTFPQVGNITISIGFTKIINQDSPVVILGHADQALYHAKGNGRNQVCFYDDLVSQGHLKVQVTDSDVEFF